MKKIYLLVMLFAGLSAGAEERAYLYPDILRKLPNVAENSLGKWTAPTVPGYETARVKGTPFDPSGEALFMKSQVTNPNYWGCAFKLKGGHRYLVGVWVKNDNAKILSRFFGQYGNPPKKFDQRIYYFTGFNQFLEPYLSDKTKSVLAGDTAGWKLLYRQIEAPPEAADYIVNMHVGIYFTTGKIHIAAPFIIDVTDNKNLLLAVDIESGKPVSAVRVFEQGNRDEVWAKKFNPPVKSFQGEVPGTYFTRRLDRDEIEGYSMQVEYADGRQSVFFAPQEKITQNR